MSPPLRRRGTVLFLAATATVLGTAVPASAAPPVPAPPPAASVPAAPVPAAPVPAAPIALWASTIGTTISLAWEEPRSGSPATSFRVYEYDQVVARVTTTSATLEAPFNSSHTYTVAAVDRRGRESARSAAVTGRTWVYGYNAECLPISSVALTISDVTPTAFSVSWTRHPLGGQLQLSVDGQPLGFTSTTSARIGGLNPGTTHSVTLYRANRCSGGGPGGPTPSPSSSGGPGGGVPVGSAVVTTAAGTATPPPAPTGLTVTGSTDSALGLSWTAPASAPASYKVYDGATLVAVTADTALTVDRLFPATTHRFTVSSADAAGDESASVAVTASTETCLRRPPVPTALGATATSSSSVRLGWTLEAAATSYTVLDRGTPVLTTRYAEAVVTGLAPASTHVYQVVAALAQGCGDSPSSRPARVTTSAGSAARPAAPATLAVTGNTAGTGSSATVTLTWAASAGGEPTTGYRLYQGATVVGTTTGTSVSVVVGSNTTHEYVVVAVAGSGAESAPSPRVTVRATYLPPP